MDFRNQETDITGACPHKENGSGDIRITGCLQIHVWHLVRVPVREDFPQPCPHFLYINGRVDSQCDHIGRKFELLHSIIPKSQNEIFGQETHLFQATIVHPSSFIDDAVAIQLQAHILRTRLTQHALQIEMTPISTVIL